MKPELNMKQGQKPSADQAVLDLCDEVWKFRLEESPEMSTFLGFHGTDDKWDDITEEGYSRRTKCVEDFLRRAIAVDVSQCSADVGLSHSLLVDDLQLHVNGARFKPELMPVNAMEGIHIDADLMISYMKYDTVEDFTKYISRLERLPQRIKDTTTMMQKGFAQGILMFHSTVVDIPDQIGSLLTEDIDNLGILKPFTEEHKDIPSDVLGAFQKQAKELVVSRIQPAFAEMKTYLEKEYLPHTRPQEGMGSLPNGDAWFQQCLDFHLSCSMTPQQVHDIGLREVERIKAQILTIADKENLGDSLQEILQGIIKKQEHCFKSSDEVLTFVRNLCSKRIRPALKSIIKDVPKIEMTVSAFPPYRTQGPIGYYNAGLPDGSRDGTFFINTLNQKECLPFLLPALSLHEGEPGHHIQMTQALAATHLPDFQRYSEGLKYYLVPNKFPIQTAYSEGWGLYAEALGEEMSMYHDNFEFLGRYAFEIHRAARLVVDTGIHAYGWDTERAVQYMVENNLMVESKIRKEVERYILIPGQACSYKIGEIKIWEMRRKVEKELGENFDVKDFHDCILKHGRVSFKILEQIVDKYIQEKLCSDGAFSNFTNT